MEQRNWKLGDDLRQYDNVLDPITFDDLILLAQNINPANGGDLHKEFNQLLQEKTTEAREMFESNYDEIMQAAFPDEYKDKPKFRLSPEEIEKLAVEIREFLLSNEMWVDIRIYFNNKCFSTTNPYCTASFNNDREHLLTIENIDPFHYFDYADGCLSMSFEGDFYEVINEYYGVYGDKLENQFSEILRKYGLHYELGNAWNLSCYDC